MTKQNGPASSARSALTSEDANVAAPPDPFRRNKLSETGSAAQPPAPDEFDGAGLEDGRPLETLSLPRAEARRKLAEQIEARFNIPELVARAVARAVKDPAAARQLLDFLVRRRFRGGSAWCLATEVWAPAMVPSLANARAKGRHPYPAALAASKPLDEDPLRPVSLHATPQNGSPVLEVFAENQRDVKRTLKANETRVLERNDLRSEIAFDGVREHVLAFPTLVKHADGTPAVAIMMTADGSSRTTAAHDLTGTDTVKAVYDYPADERAWRTHMAPIVAVQTQSITTVTDDDWARHRVVVMPAFIVLRVESEGPDHVTALDAYRALTGAIHVQPPKPWMPTATLDEKADAVLGALNATGLITEEYRTYLEGGYTPEEAEAYGYSRDLGVRSAHVVATIMRPPHRVVVNAGVRTVTGGRNVQPIRRAEVAAGLILRPISHLFKTDRDLDGARSILERTLVMPEFNQTDWTPPNQPVDPENLLDRATDELADSSPIGPDRIALASEALMWLVVSEVPAAAGGSSGERVFRRDRSGELEDKRSGAAVMSVLLESNHGLYQLVRAVEAGRQGQPIPYVREDLHIDRDGRGQPILLDNTKLRDMAHAPTSAETNGSPSFDTSTPPQEKVRTHANRLAARVDEVSAELKALEAVETRSGESFVKQHGIPRGLVLGAVEELNRIGRRLDMHGEKYDEARDSGVDDDYAPGTSDEGANP